MTFKTYLFYLMNHEKCFSEIGILKRKHLLLNMKEQVKDLWKHETVDESYHCQAH